ncbi:MAG TPA: DUF4249 domain-containing protein [Fulvivirga sp.]|nr:DUF4249 domain-containing protein [Fulvivirga sp.]
MKAFRYIFILLSVLLFSCEDVIVLDLNDGDPRLVIEGYVTDQPGPYTVKISKTAKFYDDNIFPPQSGASVVITDDQGNEDILTEVSTGVYQTSTLQGERGVTYTLSVDYEGQNYTAISKMPEQQILLDSITSEYEENSFFNDEGYYVRAHFNDPAGVANYYRFNVLVNGEVYVFDFDGEEQEDDFFYLWSDKFSDGNLNDYDFPHTLEVGDSVYIEMYNLERSTYDYYRTVADVINGGGVAPSNPLSNFGDTALGYFGAFSITSNYVIVD